MRQSIVTSVSGFFIKSFLNQLLDILININWAYLPENIVNLLKDKLSERDITMRLYGLADGILYQFWNKFNEIGREIAQLPDEKREHEAIILFENGLEEFVKGELSSELNKNLWRTVKNHAEYLEQEIINTLNAHRRAIHDQIAKMVRKSEKVELERQKILVINREYAELIKLSSEL